MEKVRCLNYTTIFDNKIAKRLLKLSEDFRQRLRKKIDKAEVNPFRHYNPVEGTDHYKLRVGNYRIIADIDTSKKIISIRVIEHRSQVYKNL